jgi:general secretion pathway protein N
MSIVKLRKEKVRHFGRTAFITAFLTHEPEEGLARVLRMHRRMAWLGALLGLFVGVIAFLPASLVAHELSVVTSQHLQLAEVEGTVWHGSGLTVLTGGVDSHEPPSVLPSRIEWRLRPHWNGVSLHLTQDCCLPQGLELALVRGLNAWRVTVGGSGFAAEGQGGAASATRAFGSAQVVADASTPIGEWPASLLEGLGFPANTLKPNGRLTLTAQNLAFAIRGGQARMLGHAQLEIRQASSRITTLDTLGSYRLVLDADPTTEATPGTGADRARLTLTTLEGSLILDGTGEIGPNGLRFRGTAKAAPGSEDALNNLLNIIGRRNGALSAISIG